MRPHGVMFHHFHGDRHPAGQGSISEGMLRSILESIDLRRILPADEWMFRAAAGRLRPTDLCLTFDDNLRCQYDIALPVLQSFGLTAFWFVYTSVMQGNIERLEVYRHFRTTQFGSVDDFYAAFFVALHESEHRPLAEVALANFDPPKYLADFTFYSDGDRRFRFVRDEVLGPTRYAALMDGMMRDSRYEVAKVAKTLWMGDDEVRRLHDEGHVIGLHSHTHPTRLERLPADEQRYEYRENLNYLTALLGTRPTTVSHPCNSYNAETLEILRDLGITLGFRANLTPGRHSMLEIPREDHANLARQIAA